METKVKLPPLGYSAAAVSETRVFRGRCMKKIAVKVRIPVQQAVLENLDKTALSYRFDPEQNRHSQYIAHLNKHLP